MSAHAADSAVGDDERVAAAPPQRPHQPAWLDTPAGQRARDEVEGIIRRTMRRRADWRRA